MNSIYVQFQLVSLKSRKQKDHLTLVFQLSQELAVNNRKQGSYGYRSIVGQIRAIALFRDRVYQRYLLWSITGICKVVVPEKMHLNYNQRDTVRFTGLVDVDGEESSGYRLLWKFDFRSIILAVMVFYFIQSRLENRCSAELFSDLSFCLEIGIEKYM